jgi:hypothetical protein
MSQIKRSFVISRVDQEQRMVYGIAATDQLATDGYIVTKEAMQAAWANYMTYANIREMHQDIAAGVVKEFSFEDDGVHIGVYVADDSTWAKVKAGVLKAFSIGAEALQKIGNVITEIILYEISLVDRPADPGAVVTMFRGYNTRSANNRGRSPKGKSMNGNLSRAGLAASKPIAPPAPAASVLEQTKRDDGGILMDDNGDDSQQDAISALMDAFHNLESLTEQVSGHVGNGQTTDSVLAHVQNAHRSLGRALTEHVKAATAYDPGEDSHDETDADVAGAGVEAGVEAEGTPTSSQRAAKPVAGRASISRNGNGGLAAQVAELTKAVGTLVRNGGLVKTPRAAGYQPAAQLAVAPQPVIRSVSKSDDHVAVVRAEADDGFPAQGTAAWKGLDEDTRIRVAIERNNKNPDIIKRIGINSAASGRN